MKVLTIFFKFLYLVLPFVVIPFLAHRWDNKILLLGIVFSLFGSIGRICEYRGLPIFFIGLWIYFQYYGYGWLGSFTFFGICLLWGYLCVSIEIRCKNLIKLRAGEKLVLTWSFILLFWFFYWILSRCNIICIISNLIWDFQPSICRI